MRLYSNAEEENIHIQKEIKSWLRSGLITEGQFEKFTGYFKPEVKQINFFFKCLLFIFTIIFVQSNIHLILWKLRIDTRAIVALIFLILSFPIYFLAEYLIKKYLFYRHGIEEALVTAAGVLFCAGTIMMMKELNVITDEKHLIIFSSLLVSGFSLFLYKRFGYIIMALLSIIALAFIPFQLELPPFYERLFLFIAYALILYINLKIDEKTRLGFQKFRNSIIQACLLLGMYLVFNLRIQNIQVPLNEVKNVMLIKYGGMSPIAYWVSFVLICVLPAITFSYGLLERKRPFIDTGLVMTILTILTYKDYFGLLHQTWDPVVFGLILITVSVVTIKWFEIDKNKLRFGYTSESVLKPENYGIDIATLGILAKMPAAADSNFEGFPGGGGQSGGAGTDRGF